VRLEEGGRAGVGGLGVGDALVEIVAGVEAGGLFGVGLAVARQRQSRLEAPEQVGTDDDMALGGA
jgi:hypothetical protein